MTALERKIPAYMLAFVRVEDYETFAVADNPEPIEGTLPKGRLVILEFPSKQDAEGFYNDPEYQPLKKIRKQMSESDSTIFERGF